MPGTLPGRPGTLPAPGVRSPWPWKKGTLFVDYHNLERELQSTEWKLLQQQECLGFCQAFSGHSPSASAALPNDTGAAWELTKYVHVSS